MKNKETISKHRKQQTSQHKHLFYQLRNPTVQNPIMQHYQLINTKENTDPAEKEDNYHEAQQ